MDVQFTYMYKLKLASFAIPIRSHEFPGVLILEAATPPPQEQMSIFVHTHTPIGVSAAIILCAKSTDFLFLSTCTYTTCIDLRVRGKRQFRGAA